MRAAAGGGGGRAESQVSKSITAGHRGSGKLNWFVYQGGRGQTTEQFVSLKDPPNKQPSP